MASLRERQKAKEGPPPPDPNPRGGAPARQNQATTSRWAAAIKAGHRPQDFGYDENMNRTAAYTGKKLVNVGSASSNSKPDMSAAEAARRRVEAQTNDALSRQGKPLTGTGITSSNQAGTGPSAAPAFSMVPPVLPQPSFPDGNGDRIPDLVQPNAGQPRSMINGQDASVVLKQGRDRAIAAANLLPTAAQREAAMPFSPLRSEREYYDRASAAEVLKKAAVAPAAGAGSKPEATPPAVASPSRPTTPPAAPNKPSESSPAKNPVTGGSSPVLPGPALLNTAARAGGAAVNAAVGGAAANAERVRDAKTALKNAQGVTKTGMDSWKWGKELVASAAHQVQEKTAAFKDHAQFLKDEIAKANAYAAQGGRTIIEPEVTARLNTLREEAAAAEKILEKQKIFAASRGDMALRLSERGDDVAKDVAAVLKQNKGLGARLLKGVARATKSVPAPIAKAAKVLGKVAGPAIDAYNTAKLLNELKTKNLEDTSVVSARSNNLLDAMDKGGLRKLPGEALKTAYNLVPASVGGGGQTATEGAAVVRAMGDAMQAPVNALGELEVSNQLAHAALRNSLTETLRRQKVYPDEVWDRLPREQKMEYHAKAARDRQALIKSRRQPATR